MRTTAKSVNKSSRQSKQKRQTPLIRIFAPDKSFLETLAEKKSQSMPEVLNGIIEKYKRQEFFDDLAGAYADLRADASAWRKEKEDRKLYENTLLDGIADE